MHDVQTAYKYMFTDLKVHVYIKKNELMYQNHDLQPSQRAPAMFCVLLKLKKTRMKKFSTAINLTNHTRNQQVTAKSKHKIQNWSIGDTTAQQCLRGPK